MPIDKLKDQQDAQISEVHESTADASRSPTAEGDERTTPSFNVPAPKSAPVELKPPTEFHIVKDETDAGGPLVIESSDPELNPPHVPIDPFPTDGTPQIDLPVAR